jgi:murein DD-endopeptidase MepM/ murein hydrolase activator NlpD
VTSAAFIIRVAILMAAAVGFSQAAVGRHWNRRPPARDQTSMDVRPTAKIDVRIAYEVARSREILDNFTRGNLLASPYLTSAIYYHDGFLAGFPVERLSADPERRIVGQVCNMLTRESKARFVQLLHEIWAESEPSGPERLMVPLIRFAFGEGSKSHRDAIDLFAPEGSPVHSASQGIVILADRGWSAVDFFSTSSRKGGNAVIIFDPDQDRFYRYCHLSTVLVRPGEIVAAGRVIGTVGHTGINASKPRHGHHLHFEVNEYAGGRVRVIDNLRLRAMLLSWRSCGRCAIWVPRLELDPRYTSNKCALPEADYAGENRNLRDPVEGRPN